MQRGRKNKKMSDYSDEELARLAPWMRVDREAVAKTKGCGLLRRASARAPQGEVPGRPADRTTMRA